MTSSARRPGLPPRILIVGGGYVGLYTALRALRRFRSGEAVVTVVDPHSYMTYQPFLPEAAAGSIEARHVAVPLRRVLKGAEVISGHVTSLEHERGVAHVQPLEGPAYELTYDHVVVAVGSISRTLPIPGLAEQGTGFKTIEEAIQLRNQVIECMDIAQSTRDEALRRRALTFVVVGGGYSGIEVLGELEDMSRYATRYYSRISPQDLSWHLVEASGRILPEVGEDMGRWTVEQLRERGIQVHLQTKLESCVDGHVVLSDGTTMESETLVWTAGVKPNPFVGDTGFRLDDHGRLVGRSTLQVEGHDDAWVAGDCSAIPDLGKPGEWYTPSAQHAVRQAKVLGDNLVAAVRGKPLGEYRHEYVGSVASLGLYKGVAQVYGVQLKGFPAWFMHRTYHVSRVPTLTRKLNVVLDWTQALFFRREIVSLWGMHEPFEQFQRAAGVLPARRPAPSDHDTTC
ncbi:MAG TPA: NAD(P)/FAD-dependent oxidoreductase [Actinomycetes bacterium]|nr:NAD(P)/FAD-dependent oxidoreductase [Actinomycetes bacterium]